MDFGLSYSEMLKYDSFGDRLKYLQLWDKGYHSPRDISYEFYKSEMWKQVRKAVLIRDLGWDLGVVDVEILGTVYIHHINPISLVDLEDMNPMVLDMENLITVSHDTHMAIHYKPKVSDIIVRKPGDTKLW